MNELPLVSICCATYNHASFIHQCLDGIINQKTNFPIEVLINDDASTDGTADIIKEYEQKYPEIIKPVYQTENQHSKKLPISRVYIFPRIKGKYMAICEGDDYWTDENKLQKQVDFLENNSDYSICFHSYHKYYEEDKRLEKKNPDWVNKNSYTIKDLASGNLIGNLSVMYRYNKEVFEDLNNFPILGMGDYILHMLFAKHGSIMELPEVMAVYRIHKNGIWSMKNVKIQTSIYLKVLAALIFHFMDDQEICAILVEQYKKHSAILYPEIHETPLIAENKNLKDKLDGLYNSNSWRITKPLRLISSFLKRNKIT